MSTHNICFYEEVRKIILRIITKYSSLTSFMLISYDEISIGLVKEEYYLMFEEYKSIREDLEDMRVHGLKGLQTSRTDTRLPWLLDWMLCYQPKPTAVSCFSQIKCGDTHWNGLAEMIPMSSWSICLAERFESGLRWNSAHNYVICFLICLWF